MAVGGVFGGGGDRRGGWGEGVGGGVLRSCVVGVVRPYGGGWVFREGELDGETHTPIVVRAL